MRPTAPLVRYVKFLRPNGSLLGHARMTRDFRYLDRPKPMVATDEEIAMQLEGMTERSQASILAALSQVMGQIAESVNSGGLWRPEGLEPWIDPGVAAPHCRSLRWFPEAFAPDSFAVFPRCEAAMYLAADRDLARGPGGHILSAWFPVQGLAIPPTLEALGVQSWN